MSNVFRYLRGDMRALRLPKYASDAVEIGDLLYWDGANDAVRPASTVVGGNYATKKTALAAAFVGVAQEASPSGAEALIAVATAGDYIFAAPTGAGTDCDVTDAVAGGDGSTMLDQTVVKTTSLGDAIGRVIAPKTTSQAHVTVRLASGTSTIY